MSLKNFLRRRVWPHRSLFSSMTSWAMNEPDFKTILTAKIPPNSLRDGISKCLKRQRDGQVTRSKTSRDQERWRRTYQSFG